MGKKSEKKATVEKVEIGTLPKKNPINKIERWETIVTLALLLSMGIIIAYYKRWPTQLEILLVLNGLLLLNMGFREIYWSGEYKKLENEMEKLEFEFFLLQQKEENPVMVINKTSKYHLSETDGRVKLHCSYQLSSRGRERVETYPVVIQTTRLHAKFEDLNYRVTEGGAPTGDYERQIVGGLLKFIIYNRLTRPLGEKDQTFFEIEVELEDTINLNEDWVGTDIREPTQKAVTEVYFPPLWIPSVSVCHSYLGETLRGTEEVQDNTMSDNPEGKYHLLRWSSVNLHTGYVYRIEWLASKKEKKGKEGQKGIDISRG